ncbi:hypothetical protein LSAT2_016197 [Lamellibrachia satsuma]|nr:hypothetical protein LSAT2_016197 [Lamellibrachia satsuma]
MSQYSCHGGLQRLTNVWHGTIPDQTIPHQITFVLPTSRLLLVCFYATLAGKPTHPTTKAKQNYARPPKLHQKIIMPHNAASKTEPVDSESRSHHRLQRLDQSTVEADHIIAFKKRLEMDGFNF